MDNDIYDKINNLYTKGGFFSKYAFHLWSSIVLIFIVFLIVSYYYVMNHLQPIKNDWANQRCNPAIIPFAGMIVKPNDKTIMQATEENFAQCTHSILKNITDYAFVPIYYVANTITEVFNEAVNAVNSLRGILDKMRESINSITTDIMGRALNVTLPLLNMVIYMRHVIGKTQATLTASVFTFLGGYLTLNSFFVFVYDLIIDVMYVIVSFIVACFAVGWLFPPTLAVGLAASAFLTVLLVPVIILQIFMADIFKVRGKSPPGIPSYHCFDRNTKLKMKNKEKKFICDIQPGDELYDGSLVTSVIKSSACRQEFYKLNNIIVTGKHKIYHNTLGWIYVDKHPDSSYIDNYNEPYVYCLNTTNKLIQINNTIFCDWDEINNNVLNLITKKCPEINPYKSDDIYKNLDCGLHPDTEIMLEDGSRVNIKDVEVNDVLLFGEKVTSIIKLYTKNCKEYNDLMINDFTIKCSGNTSIYNNSLGNKFNISKQRIEPPPISYHIITNTGNIKLNGIILEDFNSGLDKFLI
jgi:hypothetical protein